MLQIRPLVLGQVYKGINCHGTKINRQIVCAYMLRASYFYQTGRPRLAAIMQTIKIAVVHRTIFCHEGDWILHIAF